MRWISISLVIVVIVACVGLVLMADGFYLVRETENVIITQFGKPTGHPVTTPGLKFRIPFLQRTNTFDMRIRWWDGAANEIATADRVFVAIDGCAQWRISDPMTFFQTVGHERGAQSRLDEILDGEIRATVAKTKLSDVVRSSNRELFFFSGGTSKPEEITVGRAVLEREILVNSSTQVAGFGIEIVDFQFERTNYAKAERQKIADRMIAERTRIADGIRADAIAEAARIRRGR